MEKQLVAVLLFANFGATHFAFAEQPKTGSESQAPSSVVSPSPHATKATDTSAADSDLDKIKSLRNAGKLSEAQSLALSHLQKNPNDVDVILVSGLMYLQQKNYTQAETCFYKVLQAAPNYTDAQIGLIRVKMATQHYDEAESLLDKALLNTPKDEQLLALKKQLAYVKSTSNSKPQSSKAATVGKEHPHAAKAKPKHHRMKHHALVLREDPDLVLAKKYISEKQYAKAQELLRRLVAQAPDNTRFRIALADFYLLRGNDLRAYFVVEQGLRRNPHNVDLLIKEGEIHAILREFALADRSFQKAHVLAPSDKRPPALLSEVDGVSPRYRYGVNEIGISTDNAYVPDVHSVWDYSSIYLARDTTYGRLLARINSASRLDQSGAQYQLSFSPRFNRNVYVDLDTAYSDKPSLFPNRMGAAEAYVNFPGWFELSGGGKYAKIAETHLTTYTGSFNLYPGNYWLSFRPYYFVPQNSNNSAWLYTASARKYFATDDHYIGISAGTGHSPDLADLLTVDFFVIKNSFVNLNYTFPICNHNFVIDLGVGYQRWVYPSSLVRNLYDGNVGIKYRF